MNWWGSKCRLTCKPDCAARLHLTKLQTAAILCFHRKNCKQKPALRNCVQHTYLLNSEQVLIFQSQNGGNGLGCSIFADFHSLIDQLFLAPSLAHYRFKFAPRHQTVCDEGPHLIQRHTWHLQLATFARAPWL